MPLYAFCEKNYVHAADAIKGGSYRCIECNTPMKVRGGKNRIPHFYHLRVSPGCYLYNKSEDHLLVQLQIQNFLSPQEIQMEVPFLAIQRIADLVWEKEKIIFEIQCSPILLQTSQARIEDYRKIGYEVIWLLDDRIFNRKRIKPPEIFLRTQACYFFRFQRNHFLGAYDQWEIVSQQERIKRSKPLWIDLRKPRKTPQLEQPAFLPLQVKSRLVNSPFYLHGDRIHQSLQAAASPLIALCLSNWKIMEEKQSQLKEKTSWIHPFLKKYFIIPYTKCLEGILHKLS